MQRVTILPSVQQTINTSSEKEGIVYLCSLSAAALTFPALFGMLVICKCNLLLLCFFSGANQLKAKCVANAPLCCFELVCGAEYGGCAPELLDGIKCSCSAQSGK